MDLPVASDPLHPTMLYPARRLQGVVEVPIDEGSSSIIGQDRRLRGEFPSIAAESVVSREQEDTTDDAPIDQTKTEYQGEDILVVQTPEGERAYWIQRKMCKTTCGSMRLGCHLTRCDDDSNRWTVESHKSRHPVEFVAIKIQGKQTPDNTPKTCRDPTVEIAALQVVTEYDPQGLGHVVTATVCGDEDLVYIIMPHFGDGSLAEYIAERGRLPEGIARHFFRQIITGLCTLKRVGLCHHDLSAESVLLRGSDCFLVGLGLALRVSTSQEESQVPTLCRPQDSCGSQLLFLAPEILQNVPFDPHAVDLWAAGVILAIMLYGPGAPFAWASPDDKQYRDIAIKGNLRRVARKWESRNSGHLSPVSDEALDLLQCMLKAKPTDRLTLEDIQQHPWFIAEDSGYADGNEH